MSHEELMAWPWLLAVCWPLAMAVLLAASGPRGPLLTVAAWSAAPALVVALVVPPASELPWLLLGTRFELDSIGRIFLAFTAVLWMAGGVYARAYMRHDRSSTRFFVFLLAAMAGNIGLIVAGDAVSFYTCFALMSFASYGLIVHAGDREALEAGRTYVTLVIVGEILIFAGLLSWVAATGRTHIVGWAGLAVALPGPVASGLLLVGFGIKAGALPLHVWLPLAHPVAPTPASAILSGAMIKAGLFGWIRFLPLGESALPGWGVWCIGAGLAAAFGGAVAGTLQSNPKVTLAYSSISQMGLMTVAVGTGLAVPGAWPVLLPATVFHALHHAWAKGALFLGVGVAAHPGTGAWQQRAIGAGLILPALSMAGAPLTSGAIAKLALKNALPPPFEAVLAFALSLAAIGTTCLMLRFLVLAWRSAPARGPLAASGTWWPWAALTGLVVALGFGGAGATGLTAGAAVTPADLWALSWPLLAGIAVSWTAARVWPASRPIPGVPPGDLLWAVLAAFRRVRVPSSLELPTLAAPRAWLTPGREAWRGLPRADERLSHWHVTGLVLLVLLGAFAALAL